MTDTVRILGIDPGSLATGYGVIESDGTHFRYLTSGCLRTGEGEFSARLRIIYDGIAQLVVEHQPDEVAIESVFVNRNASSALKLGQARAAALCGTFARDLPFYEYAPRAVKQAVVGQGGAAKEQVQHMVRILLGLRRHVQADEADALAVALCHAQSRGLIHRLAKAGGRWRRS